MRLPFRAAGGVARPAVLSARLRLNAVIRPAVHAAGVGRLDQHAERRIPEFRHAPLERGNVCYIREWTRVDGSRMKIMGIRGAQMRSKDIYLQGNDTIS